MPSAFEVPAQLATTMSGHTASVLCIRATSSGIRMSSFCSCYAIGHMPCTPALLAGLTQHPHLVQPGAGKYCLSGAKDRTVRLWNPTKGTHVNTYRGNGGDVAGVAVSTDNHHFVACGTDKSINHFDVASGSVLRRFSGHDGAVNAVQYAADESLLVSASYDSTVRFWDLKGRSTRPTDTIKAASDSITCLATPSNATVIAGAVDGTVTAIDVRGGRLVRDLLQQPVTSVTAPADGLYVAAACTDSSVRLLDSKTGAILASYAGHVHREFQLECALLADDSVIACGSEDGTPQCWAPQGVACVSGALHVHARHNFSDPSMLRRPCNTEIAECHVRWWLCLAIYNLPVYGQACIVGC